MRVGTLVGAILDRDRRLPARGRRGAPDRAHRRRRLGRAAGSAKVDGGADELLGLQDRLASSLFASAGLPAGKVQKLTKRARPKVPYRALELYGDAVLRRDDKKKRDLLQQAVAAAPQLSYAVQDLEALQQRMGAYSAVANVKLDERERALVARADDGKRAPAERAAAAQGGDGVARRRAPLSHARRRRRALEQSSLPAPPSSPPPPQFQALDGLHRWDAALAAGEAYLKRIPDRRSLPRARDAHARDRRDAPQARGAPRRVRRRSRREAAGHGAQSTPEHKADVRLRAVHLRALELAAQRADARQLQRVSSPPTPRTPAPTCRRT